MYQGTSHKKLGSVVINVQSPIQTEDYYTATGILKNVGNVTDAATYVTTHLNGGKSSSVGKAIL